MTTALMIVGQSHVRSFTYTNTTNAYQVVGNYQDVVSSGHATRKDAAKSFDAAYAYIEDSDWGVVNFVAPGETVQGELIIGNPCHIKSASDRATEWMAAAKANSELLGW